MQLSTVFEATWQCRATARHILDFLDPEWHWPQAHVGGGYLRDAVFGGTPKDIDVFVPISHADYAAAGMVNRESTIQFMCAAFPNLRPEMFGTVMVLPGYDFLRCLRVAEVRIPGVSLPVQIVFIPEERYPTVEASIEGFDIDACQIGCSRAISLFTTHQFMDAAAGPSFSIVRWGDTPEEWAHVENHAKRLKAKYPDIPFEWKHPTHLDIFTSEQLDDLG